MFKVDLIFYNIDLFIYFIYVWKRKKGYFNIWRIFSFIKVIFSFVINYKIKL